MPRITHRADLMHNSYASNLGLAITSNYVLTADGQGGLSWAAGGTLSYASNSNDVSAVGAAGASTLVPRADHVHRSPLYFVNSTTARLVTNTIHQASTATTGTLTLNSGTADLLADSGSSSCLSSPPIRPPEPARKGRCIATRPPEPSRSISEAPGAQSLPPEHLPAPLSAPSPMAGRLLRLRRSVSEPGAWTDRGSRPDPAASSL